MQRNAFYNLNKNSGSKKFSVKEFARTLWDAVGAWIEDNAASMGAAVAYYTIFSLAPLLLMIIAIAGFVFGHDAAQSAILHEFDGLIGSNGAQAVQAILRGTNNTSGGIVSLIVGSLTLFIGATSVFAELQSSIDKIWRAKPRPGTALWNLLKIRLLSFGLIIGVGFLLIVSLAVSSVLAALETFWSSHLEGWENVLQLSNTVISFVVITILFALIYKVLPSIKLAWNDVWWGAAVTSFLFSLGKYAIGLYIGKSALSSSFGAAGAFVILIAWVYYSAQIFFLGTEFTYLYTTRFGSLSNEETAASLHAVPDRSNRD